MSIGLRYIPNGADAEDVVQMVAEVNLLKGARQIGKTRTQKRRFLLCTTSEAAKPSA